MKQEWYETKNQALERLRKMLRKKKLKRIARLCELNELTKFSMPLMYDNPKESKLVYRVQTAAQEGPYRIRLETDEEPEFEPGAQPAPYDFAYEGQDFTNKELDSLFKKKEPLLFGFENPYDAVLWFGQEELEKLYKKGFRVYEMYAHKIYLSHTKRQIMFVKDESRPEKELSLQDVLKNRGKELEKGKLSPKTYDVAVKKRLDAVEKEYNRLMVSAEPDTEKLSELINEAIGLCSRLGQQPSWLKEAINMLGIPNFFES